MMANETRDILRSLKNAAADKAVMAEFTAENQNTGEGYAAHVLRQTKRLGMMMAVLIIGESADNAQNIHDANVLYDVASKIRLAAREME